MDVALSGLITDPRAASLALSFMLGSTRRSRMVGWIASFDPVRLGRVVRRPRRPFSWRGRLPRGLWVPFTLAVSGAHHPLALPHCLPGHGLQSNGWAAIGLFRPDLSVGAHLKSGT
jgi:hypothetical protein